MVRFAIIYETRGLVIEATATVIEAPKSIDGAESMVRKAFSLAVDEGHQGMFRFTQLTSKSIDSSQPTDGRDDLWHKVHDALKSVADDAGLGPGHLARQTNAVMEVLLKQTPPIGIDPSQTVPMPQTP